MPTCIYSLFAQFEILNYSLVQWGTKINEEDEGIYIITKAICCTEPKFSSSIHFDRQAIIEWIERVPKFTVDGITPTVECIQSRLKEFWYEDEFILYIGKAPKRKKGTGIGTRVKEYYITKLGNGGPHSGGQWLKCISSLEKLNVYYAPCKNPANMERNMLKTFMKNVSAESLKSVYDKELPLPFANIKFGRNKRHGFKYQRL